MSTDPLSRLVEWLRADRENRSVTIELEALPPSYDEDDPNLVVAEPLLHTVEMVEHDGNTSRTFSADSVDLPSAAAEAWDEYVAARGGFTTGLSYGFGRLQRKVWGDPVTPLVDVQRFYPFADAPPVTHYITPVDFDDDETPRYVTPVVDVDENTLTISIKIG